MLPDPEVHPTVGASEVASAYGIGINAAYAEGRKYLDSAGAEGIPALRIGRSLRFPTAAVRAHLGLKSDNTSNIDAQRAGDWTNGRRR